MTVTTMPAEDVCLSLGANLGDARGTLLAAAERIRLLDGVYGLRCSGLYATQPVGKADQPEFVNCAVCLRTEMPAQQLLKALKSLEQQMGRQQRPQWHPRELDIDILLFGALCLAQPGLTIPHPQMHLRRFVLQPLSDIAPLALHPGLGLTVRQMLRQCTDPAYVRLLADDHET